MTKMKSHILLLITAACICTTTVISIPAVSAAEASNIEVSTQDNSQDDVPTAVSDTASSIIHIIVSCADENGKTFYLHQGSGFLVASDSNAQYVMTSQTLITPTEDELSQIRKLNGLDTSARLTTQIQFIFDPDIAINANVVTTGIDSDYAILSPDTALKNRDSLRMSSSSTILRKQAIYGYGYNIDSSILGESTVPDSVSTILSGSVTAIERDPVTITTDLAPAQGFTGSPLLDENGYVLGMVCTATTGTTILPVDSITKLLDTLGIGYRTTDPASDYNVVDDSTAAKLAALLTECQQDVTDNSEKYSKKSLEAYKTAINSAMEIMNSDSATKDQYQSSIDTLNKAKKKLRPAGFTAYIIQIILLAVILLFGALVIRQKRMERQLLITLHPELQKSKPSKKAVYAEPLLSNNNTSTGSTALIRNSTQEVFWLDRPEIRIGKEASEVDYCITGNSAISRYHAAIVYQNGGYYLIDNNSTNRTSLNSTVLSPQVPTLLQPGDTISFANEVYQFNILSHI